MRNETLTYGTRFHLLTSIPLISEAVIARVLKAAARVAVNNDVMTTPTNTHKIPNIRPPTDRGVLSPYLKTYLNILFCG